MGRINVTDRIFEELHRSNNTAPLLRGQPEEVLRGEPSGTPRGLEPKVLRSKDRRFATEPKML